MAVVCGVPPVTVGCQVPICQRLAKSALDSRPVRCSEAASDAAITSHSWQQEPRLTHHGKSRADLTATGMTQGELHQ
jgi:hypothetical protein